MKSQWIGFLLAAMVALLLGSYAIADEPAPKDKPVEKIAVPMVVQPNEVRGYRVSVAIKGAVGVADSTPMILDAVNTMKVQHVYGKREGDGLLQLDITALDPVATINGEKAPASTGEFPKLTLLLDASWKIKNVFGLENTRYGTGQVPGLNYANLIMLFLVPDIGLPHAIGEKWTSKVKSPGQTDPVTITSSIKSRDDAAKTIVLHQDYVWAEQKLESDRSVKSTASVDSTFDLATGKLLKSQAECQLPFSDPTQPKPENKQYKATTKIDISL